MMYQLHVLVKRSIQIIWETIALLYAFLYLERKEKDDGRASGVAGYIINDIKG